jgi:uncharacterized protein YqeY
MKLEILQSAKTEAMKNKDAIRKEAISAMIDAVQKASITPKGRIEITEQLTDEVLIKYQKTIQEMIDTCPANRTDLMDKYVAEMAVVKEFAPQLMTDPSEIAVAIHTVAPRGVPFVKSNKGAIMKAITPYFKGKADMKIVSQVIAEMLE